MEDAAFHAAFAVSTMLYRQSEDAFRHWRDDLLDEERHGAYVASEDRSDESVKTLLRLLRHACIAKNGVNK